MMKQRKTGLWILAAVMICSLSLFGLAGCGSATGEALIQEAMQEIPVSDETVTPSEPAAEAVTEAPAPSEPVTEAMPPQTDTADQIGEEKALRIALQHAGFSQNEVDFTSSYLDIDDGRREYEVSFHQGTMEYEYSIDASSGAILEMDVDSIYD